MKTRPIDLSITLGEYGHHIIRQNFQRFVDQEVAVLKDQDPEPLHQMRVGMRRLRTAVQVFSTAIALPKDICKSSIGKIAKDLGETRDLDVLQQTLITHYQPLLPKSERLKFAEVLKHLRLTRRERFLDLKKTLKSDRYCNLKQSIKAWITQPTFTPMGNLSVIQTLPDLLLPLICQLFIHPGWLVGTTLQFGEVILIPTEKSERLNEQLQKFEEILHGLRKQMKGVRYPAEFFSGFYEVAYLQNIDEFKQIQEILGKLQDHAVLRQFLATTMNADWAKALPTVDQIMQRDRTVFWKTWQPLQARYLSSEFRQSLRSRLIQPLESAPTLSETSISSR